MGLIVKTQELLSSQVTICSVLGRFVLTVDTSFRCDVYWCKSILIGGGENNESQMGKGEREEQDLTRFSHVVVVVPWIHSFDLRIRDVNCPII